MSQFWVGSLQPPPASSNRLRLFPSSWPCPRRRGRRTPARKPVPVSALGRRRGSWQAAYVNSNDHLSTLRTLVPLSRPIHPTAPTLSSAQPLVHPPSWPRHRYSHLVRSLPECLQLRLTLCEAEDGRLFAEALKLPVLGRPPERFHGMDRGINYVLSRLSPKNFPVHEYRGMSVRDVRRHVSIRVLNHWIHSGTSTVTPTPGAAMPTLVQRKFIHPRMREDSRLTNTA